jgi:hypothetical protein
MLSLESNRMSQQTHNVTLEASRLNRRTTELACLSQEAAVKTQYISHVNIEVGCDVPEMLYLGSNLCCTDHFVHDAIHPSAAILWLRARYILI